MYRCQDCGKKFENAKGYFEYHTLWTPPFEEQLVCPFCGSDGIQAIKVSHCRCCGARIYGENKVYCNAQCRARGEKLYRREQRRRKLRSQTPIYKIVSRIDDYNAAHGTKYSYGQFVALVLPKLSKEEAKLYI